MRSNKIMWGFVFLVVLTTIAVTTGTRDSHSREKRQPTPSPPDNRGIRDPNKYAVTDYDAPEPSNAREREERKKKNKRYDEQGWVIGDPYPNTSGVGRQDEIPPPPIIPVAESDLIIVGKIIGANAFLSNDKEGVYTEFKVKIGEVLKNDTSNKAASGESVNADRAGGYVRYPSGQKVFYENSNHYLPWAGAEYVLFLARNGESASYEIVVAYELRENWAIPLDYGRSFDKYDMTKKVFIESVRNEISLSARK
jgi:hypothetical protein